MKDFTLDWLKGVFLAQRYDTLDYLYYYNIF